MPDKYEREIEEILSNSGEAGPPGARRSRETPPDDRPNPAAAPRRGRRAFAAGLGRVGPPQSRPRPNSGALLLAGLLLLIAAALLGGGWLAWVGAGLLAAGYLLSLRARPRSSRRPAAPTRYWRGRPVDDDP